MIIDHIGSSVPHRGWPGQSHIARFSCLHPALLVRPQVEELGDPREELEDFADRRMTEIEEREAALEQRERALEAQLKRLKEQRVRAERQQELALESAGSGADREGGNDEDYEEERATDASGGRIRHKDADQNEVRTPADADAGAADRASVSAAAPYVLPVAKVMGGHPMVVNVDEYGSAEGRKSPTKLHMHTMTRTLQCLAPLQRTGWGGVDGRLQRGRGGKPWAFAGHLAEHTSVYGHVVPARQLG